MTSTSGTGFVCLAPKAAPTQKGKDSYKKWHHTTRLVIKVCATIDRLTDVDVRLETKY